VKPQSQKVRLKARELTSTSPSEQRAVINGIASDLLRLGEAHDKHDDALQAMPAQQARELREGRFTSAASGVTSFTLKNPLPSKPQHVTLALRRDDAGDFAAAWSWWWVFDGTNITMKFVGLPASTRLLYTVEFF
jgi:hypothetical protein